MAPFFYMLLTTSFRLVERMYLAGLIILSLSELKSALPQIILALDLRSVL